MQYRVILPDHDWVEEEKYKLILSVYAGIKVNNHGMGNPEAMTFSGPTVVRISSTKHSTSNAVSQTNLNLYVKHHQVL